MEIGDYRSGLRDFLINEEENHPVLMQLAKTLTKNIINITNLEEALSLLIDHGGNIQKIMHKRNITRGMLFTYLKSRSNVTIATDFTKTDLVMRVIEYWDQSNGRLQNAVDQDSIRQMAKCFRPWFFTNLNEEKLIANDFYPDVALELKIFAKDGTHEIESSGASEVLNELMSVKKKCNFVFNPNLLESGAQERVDIHGIVIILSCGTLLNDGNFVGVFEWLFGLLRDPSFENNWKVRKIKGALHSENTPRIPTIEMSETFQEVLALPAPSDST